MIDLNATTHGALTVAGLICLGVGLPLVFANAPAPYRINTTLVLGLGLAIAAFWTFVTSKGIAARRRPVRTGPQQIVGMAGQVRERNLVLVGGELWHAHSSDGRDLRNGQRVQIEALEGLELTVSHLID